MGHNKDAFKKEICTTHLQTPTIHGFSTLTQGTKSVQEYLQEWERLTVLCDVNEMEDPRVSRFIAGLKEDIKEKMMFSRQLTVHDAGNLAIEIENRNNRKK